MKIQDSQYRTIWADSNSDIQVIDQTKIPFSFEIKTLKSGNDAFYAIKDMIVRGAPLIGITAAYGVYLYARELRDSDNYTSELIDSAKNLIEARPTAVNLKWAIDKQIQFVKDSKPKDTIIRELLSSANKMAQQDIETNLAIGRHGLELIKQIHNDKGKVNILTHCNAGWFATVDYGTATAPIYLANELGYDLHVWVDETRPRNQGSKITAYELLNEGISHDIVADNTGGHLMQNGMVDLVIVGCDRVAANGDVCNKIGTYLKALAAFDNNVPFYVAMPLSTLDMTLKSGRNIPIEERDGDEVRYFSGICHEKEVEILTSPKDSTAVNYGFDITPAKLITGLITEAGIIRPKELLLKYSSEK